MGVGTGTGSYWYQHSQYQLQGNREQVRVHPGSLAESHRTFLGPTARNSFASSPRNADFFNRSHQIRFTPVRSRLGVRKSCSLGTAAAGPPSPACGPPGASLESRMQVESSWLDWVCRLSPSNRKA